MFITTNTLHQDPTSKTPNPWADASLETLASIRGVCLDIDETLSTRGKLTAEAFSALWALKKAGFCVVPLTGRPAGWCDQIARFWPVDAVIGENGAFSFFLKDGIRKRLNTPSPSQPSDASLRLKILAQKIQSEFPHVQWASDQSYREYDLAIDIAEDVPRWSSARIQSLLDLCHTEGAHAKLSSIHVNVWYGEYDKWTGFQSWLSAGAPGHAQAGFSTDLHHWLYIGDSPNDEPLFQRFLFSVGVANLKEFLPHLKFPPTWMTASESGQGFEEMAQKLIQAQHASELSVSKRPS